MDQVRFVESAYRIQHRHKDGGWGTMEEQPLHHGQAEHDPERRWGLRRIFRCTSCDERISVVEGEADEDRER
jgi:hypothetical protein